MTIKRGILKMEYLRVLQYQPSSFDDDLEFIALGNSVKEKIKSLEKVAHIVLEWELLNVVTFDISTTETVLFSISHRQ